MRNRNKELSEELEKEELTKPSDFSAETTLEDGELDESELAADGHTSGSGDNQVQQKNKGPHKKRKFRDSIEI